MRLRTHRHCTLNAGFTLLEMLAVIAILSVVAGLAIPLLLPPSEALRLEAATRTLCAGLRLTRVRAMAANAELTLVIDVANKTFRSPIVAETALPQGMGVEISVADTQRKGASVGGFLFFPGGGSSGGDVKLDFGGTRATISVNWLTGEAQCDIQRRTAMVSP